MFFFLISQWGIRVLMISQCYPVGFGYYCLQMRKMVSRFGVKYNPRWHPSVKEMHPIFGLRGVFDGSVRTVLTHM